MTVITRRLVRKLLRRERRSVFLLKSALILVTMGNTVLTRGFVRNIVSLLHHHWFQDYLSYHLFHTGVDPDDEDDDDGDDTNEPLG